AIYNTVAEAGNTVGAMTAKGITPVALEMLDGPMIRMVEAATHAGYPLDAAAVLLIELEGLTEAVEEQAEAIVEVCKASGARTVDRKSTRLNSSHVKISYAVFCLKKK